MVSVNEVRRDRRPVLTDELAERVRAEIRQLPDDLPLRQLRPLPKGNRPAYRRKQDPEKYATDPPQEWMRFWQEELEPDQRRVLSGVLLRAMDGSCETLRDLRNCTYEDWTDSDKKRVSGTGKLTAAFLDIIGRR